MRRRLYFLLPDVGSARRLVDELLLARIEQSHIHVLARDSTDLQGLPEATLLQKSDVVHGMEMGLIVGGGTGVVSGLITTLIPATQLGGGGVILACALAGSLIGAWASAMIGTDVRNSRLKSFEPAIDDGQILVMVDTAKERVVEIETLARSRHPAHVEGSEPTIPAFP
jgi:hypothetical protein